MTEVANSELVNSKRSYTVIQVWGSCNPLSCLGTYQYKIYHDLKDSTFNDAVEDTTTPRMYIQATITAFEQLKAPACVILKSNSEYLLHTIKSGKLDKWSTTGWRHPEVEAAKNTDLWERLFEVMKSHEVVCCKI